MSIETIAAKIGEKVAGSGFDRRIKIDLQGAGTIIIDGASVTVGDGEADATIAMTLDDFQELVSGELSPTMAFMSGKLKVDGDMSAAMALSQVI